MPVLSVLVVLIILFCLFHSDYSFSVAFFLLKTNIPPQPAAINAIQTAIAELSPVFGLPDVFTVGWLFAVVDAFAAVPAAPPETVLSLPDVVPPFPDVVPPFPVAAVSASFSVVIR